MRPPAPISTSHQQLDQRGFTLIELLVVFAIASLLIAVAPAAYDRMRDGAAYRDTVRNMMMQMRDARARAQTQRTDVRFVVDLAQRQYGVDGAARTTLPPAVQVRATVAERELQADGKATIRFLSQGGATGGNIEIARSHGGGTRLKVDWLSGQITQERI